MIAYTSIAQWLNTSTTDVNSTINIHYDKTVSERKKINKTINISVQSWEHGIIINVITVLYSPERMWSCKASVNKHCYFVCIQIIHMHISPPYCLKMYNAQFLWLLVFEVLTGEDGTMVTILASGSWGPWFKSRLGKICWDFHMKSWNRQCDHILKYFDFAPPLLNTESSNNGNLLICWVTLYTLLFKIYSQSWLIKPYKWQHTQPKCIIKET